ncbi:hypothetical protein PFICI_13228 [Pestalotiopsis fici W106-1]|uniref:Uncharacterized protein n=1 Tax=Pestalotiopsis fici (strain W106-1 / CGMCC3.15140) TaxID=1229662 RepID=W3WLX1_PESFW|nr:uncharacterized protein PFICI_13228 [Pestalotiopsis fici W106-1]ETS74744.1 hypothetical protein PFICI_13228 [Pestalotiopsis fici W106-1]
MYESSAAASTLTRPRIVVAAISVIAAVSAGYLLYQSRVAEPQIDVVPGPGLHRSNAVRRNRRQSLRQEDSSDADRDENVDTTATAAPIHDVESQNEPAWYTESSRQRTGENIVTLLFRVSEDNARRNAYVHRGCQCNGCGMVPIRGIRYRCANCADFDLCEVCESQGLHNKTHVFYKVRIPAPPFCPRQVQPAWYPGDPDNVSRMVPRELLARWSRETGFERVELDAYWEQWTFMANTEWKDDPDGLCLAMDRKTFERCLVPSGGYRHASPNLIHDRMFAFYDINGDDLIGFDEFLKGVSYRKRTDKLRRIFEGYDIDGDGYVCRRDFLRMFRAYYVLYKQMHRDILEGLDEHMMTTAEAQQLVNGRAPLSSFFGREGRVPPADQSRPMEGKVFRSSGEVDIHDGKNTVVNEDKPDTSSREDILNGLFARSNNRSFFTESFGPSSFQGRSSTEEQYISSIINPPTTLNDLSALISGDASSRLDDIIASIRHEVANRPARGHYDDTESNASDEAHEENEDFTHNLPTLRSQPFHVHDHGAPPRTRGLARERRNGTTSARSQRIRDERRRREQLLDRWTRRQFYLDEEEGAQPPQDWTEDEDVLRNLNGIAGSSKAPAQVLSPRSRSSSKVRFAEDTDDFDVRSIRSNHSTSTRSIPERWGGMEIPDAERDAGKEILYQVTQQAFNELLDEVFKKKEDLALACAETVDERSKYRHLFRHLEPDDLTTTPPPRLRRANSDRPVREQSLDELLWTSGYTVSPPPNDTEAAEQAPSEDKENDQPPPSQSHVGSLENETQLHTSGHEYQSSVGSYDPTMPQFRPNSNETAQSSPRTSSPLLDSVSKTTQRQTDKKSARKSHQNTSTKSSQSSDTQSTHEESLPENVLLQYKRLDIAEEEAKYRGGWGRLSFAEFEQIYKEHEFQDSSRNRLDYLGSWIDFCIP